MATTMTYNEWLAKQQTAADQTSDSALYTGALQHQMSAPTYGASAEALASRGLTGRGYSNYLANKDFTEATRKACDFTAKVIEYTMQFPTPHRDGVMLEPCLNLLFQERNL